MMLLYISCRLVRAFRSDGYLRSNKVSLAVGLVVLCIVSASLYAIADSCKTGCGTKSAGCEQQAGCGQASGCGQAGSCGATSACFSGGKVITRAYYGGTVKLRTATCPRGGSLMIAVLKQGDRPDANASVSAALRTAEGRQPVALQQVNPGVFCSEASLAGAKTLELTISGGGALSSVMSFDIPASAAQAAGKCGGRGAACGMNKGAACPMNKQAGTCKATTAGKCSGMTAGGCATVGACKKAGNTATPKCAVCKCAPCKCK
jgi:hypothetical protein